MAMNVWKEIRKYRQSKNTDSMEPPVITVVLSGNIHSRLTAGYPKAPGAPTMGSNS